MDGVVGGRHHRVSVNQITYDLDYVHERSRLTTFFRWLLAIPVEIFLLFYLLAVYVAVFIAWFALLFTARYPRGLYDFIAGGVRLNGRVHAYAFLAVDPYPPFSGGEHPEYPARIVVGPPLEKYSRLKVFFIGIYSIPVLVIAWAMNIVASVCSFLAWFVILVTGKQAEGLQDAIKLGVSYTSRALGISFMLTQHYPPISAEAGEANPGPPPMLPGDAPVVPAAPETPATPEAPETGPSIGI